MRSLYGQGIDDHVAEELGPDGPAPTRALPVTSQDLDEHGRIEVTSVTLDEVLHDEPIAIINMYIEGEEPKTIARTSGLIVDRRTVLAICINRRQEPFFTIPSKLRDVVGNYRIYIHRYGDQFGKIVGYEVPS